MNPLEVLLDQIRQERGLDLRSYKSSFLERRLAVRLRARDCPDYLAYSRLLRRDPGEYVALLDALAIHLTRFFRDASTFRALEETFLPELLRVRAQERHLRIWSAGCAGGEEPYSLAILLREMLGTALRHWQVEILATDVDEQALRKAVEGRYDSVSLQDVAPRYRPWLERYFSPGPEYQLAPEVREMVTFRRLDLIADPPPMGLDLLLCRNVLIYFERAQQERLYEVFQQSLRSDGLLVLGKTEMLPLSWIGRFSPVDLREHIYRRTVASSA